jgi:hypothetical protein
MRTEGVRAFLALAVLTSALYGACGGAGAGLDITTLPPRMHAPYRRFAARCSRCHSLSRPLTAPVTTVDHWVHYLARMRRQPGSGINSADAELILEFLTYYTTEMRGHSAETAGGAESAAPSTEPAPSPEESSNAS